MIGLLCIIFLFGCFSNESEIMPSQFDREFFRLSTAEQVKIFHRYGPEVQYDLLIVGNQIVHPPAFYLVEEFAKEGIFVVPILRSKLAAAKRESTIRDVVAILAEMQRLGSYEVKDDASLMDLVGQQIASMQGQWKPVTLRMFEEIQAHPQR